MNCIKLLCFNSASFNNCLPLLCLLFVQHTINLATHFALLLKHKLITVFLTKALFFSILIVAKYLKYSLFEVRFYSLFCSFVNNSMHKHTKPISSEGSGILLFNF